RGGHSKRCTCRQDPYHDNGARCAGKREWNSITTKTKSSGPQRAGIPPRNGEIRMSNHETMTKSQPTQAFDIRRSVIHSSFVILMPLVSMKLSILFATLLSAVAVLAAEEKKQKEAPMNSSNEVAVIKTSEGD